MAEALPDLQRGLAPILDAEVRVLVLGSFPGEASLAAQQYYAHPRNQFWPLMGALLDLPLPAMPYAARVRALLARHIGVWDVLGACVREGSLDAAIRHPQANDFDLLHRRAPRLRRVGFNGGTAGRFARISPAPASRRWCCRRPARRTRRARSSRSLRCGARCCRTTRLTTGSPER